MLRLARVKLTEAGIPATELRQGDMYALPLQSRSADTVIIHQVLHYAQQPAAAIAEATRLLVAGGRLLVIAFAPHSREALRTRHAHARLCFADEAVPKGSDSVGLAVPGVAPLKVGEPPVPPLS